MYVANENKYYSPRRNATEACRNLSKVFGEGRVSDRTCRRWFEKFETGDLDLSDKPCPGRPSVIDDDVADMLEQNPFLTTSEIAERPDSAQQTISDHIRKIGLVWKHSRWVPNELSQNYRSVVETTDLDGITTQGLENRNVLREKIKNGKLEERSKLKTEAECREERRKKPSERMKARKKGRKRKKNS